MFPFCRLSKIATSGLVVVLFATTFAVQPLAAQGSSLTLADVVRAVLAGHPRLEAAEARTRAALGARSAAGALGNPILSVTRESGLASSTTLTAGREGETMATATLPLDFLYQRSSRVRQADATVASRRASGAANRTSVLLDATGAYYRTALLQVEVATNRELAGWLDSLVAYQRARVVEGAAAGVALLRSQLERDRLQAELALISADAARARLALATFVRSDPAAGSLDAAPPPERPFDIADVGAFSWQARPELVAARASLAAADAGVSLARMGVIPQFDAIVGLKRIVGVNSLVSGFSLPLPLLNRNGGVAARARADRDEMSAELAALTRTAAAEAHAEVEASALLAAEVRALLPTAGDTLGSRGRADELRRIATAAYREGGTTLLELLDAATTWKESRITFYRTLYAQQQGVIAFAVAQGGDLAIIIPRLVAPRGAER